MLKILHTADWHIRDKDIEEQKKCLGYLIETAQKEQPDLIIHAGDVLDQQNIQLDTEAIKLVFQTFSELAGVAPVAAIIGTPSHEGTATEVLSHIKARYPVHVSTRPEQLYLCGNKFWAEPSMSEATRLAFMEAPVEAVISMVPAPTKQFFAHSSDIKTSDMEIAGEMSKMFAGFAAQAEAYVAPHLLVGHWNITGSLVSETQTLTGVDIELSKDQMALSNADLKLMGHIHKSQQIGKDIFYAGSITGLTWGELDDKGFYIHEISKDMEGAGETEWSFCSRFIKTPSRKLIKITEDLTKDCDIDYLLSADSIPDIKGANLKVELKVYQDEAQKINKEEIKKTLTDMGAKSVGVHLLRMPRENVRSKNILKLTTLQEKVIEWAKLRGEAVSESILKKADLLEFEDADKIIQEVASA